MLGSALVLCPASQGLSPLAPGPRIQVPGRATQGGAAFHYDSPSPLEVGCHLDSLAVVHLYHMESEAVDSTDRSHEAARGPIKATTLIHQDLWEADPVEWDSGCLGLRDITEVGICAMSKERRGGKQV